MPDLDPLHFILLGILVVFVIFLVNRLASRDQRIADLIYKNDKLARDVLKLTDVNKSQSDLINSRPKSQELREFLKDIDTKGYSLVRIDPDDVFYRGRN